MSNNYVENGGQKYILPAIFFIIIALLFLTISFYYNFIPREKLLKTIHTQETVKSPYITNLSPYIIGQEDKEIIYISNSSRIPNDLNDEKIIQLESELIYTVTLPIIKEDNLKITICNNSNSTKNIKSELDILSNYNNQKIITMKPYESFVLNFNGEKWDIISRELDDQQIIKMINDEIIGKFQKVKSKIESSLFLLMKDMITGFLEDKDLFLKVTKEKIDRFESLFEDNLSDEEFILLKDKISEYLNFENVDEKIDKILSLNVNKLKINLSKKISLEIPEFIEKVTFEIDKRISNKNSKTLILTKVNQTFELSKYNIYNFTENKIDEIKNNIYNNICFLRNNKNIILYEINKEFLENIINFKQSINQYIPKSLKKDIIKEIDYCYDKIKKDIEINLKNAREDYTKI